MIISSCSHRASTLLRSSNSSVITCRGSQQCAINKKRREYSVNSLTFPSLKNPNLSRTRGVSQLYSSPSQNSGNYSVTTSRKKLATSCNNSIKINARCSSSSATNSTNSTNSTVPQSLSSNQQSHNNDSNLIKKIATAATAALALSGGAYLAASSYDDGNKVESSSLVRFKQKDSSNFRSPSTGSNIVTPLATSSSLMSTYQGSSNLLHGGVIRVVESPSDWIEKTLTKTAIKSDIRSSSPRTNDISVRALKGSRLCMEDEYFIDNDGQFAAVFDGHGGGGVSAYLRDHLYNKVTKKISKIDDSLSGRHHHQPSLASKTKAIREAFDEIDDDVLSEDELQYQGSTAVAVILHQDDDGGHRTLISANIGDSRAILSRRGQAVDLTRDHKPNDEKEKARILAMGETVEWDHYCKVYRVRNLSLSRAVGDRFAKPAVSGDVEIKQFPVNDEGDEFVLLASDGLWDVMTSQDCVDFVNRRLKSVPRNISNEEKIKALYTKRKVMSRLLANEALRRGTGDNVCVVIVWLQDLGEMKGIR